MTFGSSILYKCPSCPNMFNQWEITSRNNFGARLYSDGKQIGPMYREWPLITKCNKCHCYFWIKDAKVIDEDFKNESLKQAWIDADPIEFLTQEELFDCLNQDVIRSDNDSAFIRKRIWWAYNDRRRQGQELFIDETDENNWRNNLLRLKSLSPTVSDKQKILVAEMNRNLGNFNEGIELLNSIKDNTLNLIVEQFREACNKKETLAFLVRW